MKYKLFSNASGGKAAPCAFFAAAAGCRNGDQCKFSHELPSKDLSSKIHNNNDDSSSGVSTESSEDEKHVEKAVSTRKEPIQKSLKRQADAIINTAKQTPKKKKNRRSESDIFVKPKSQPVKTEQRNTNPQKQAPPKLNSPQSLPLTKATKATSAEIISESDIFVKPKSNKSPQKPPPPKLNSQSPPVNKNATPAIPPFKNLNLPVASFPDPYPISPRTSESKQKEKPQLPDPQQILPNSTKVGKSFIKAIVKTREHHRYNSSYSVQKAKAQDEASGIVKSSDWIKAKPFGAWCKGNPQAIAIDCEMCQTKDPLSGAVNGKALCRISVVNAEEPYEALLDTLVKPSWPVIDHRTWVNGVTAEMLENVEFTIEHAQAFMLALCSEQTVIIGHAVSNDLFALRMEHWCNVDSSFLYTVVDAPRACPSLSTLASAVLKKEMPQTHDSVNDSITALQCVQYWLEKDGDVSPVEHKPKAKIVGGGGASKLGEASKLFVHRIPKICQKNHLVTLFQHHTSVFPSEVEEIKFTGDNGKTHVVFHSPEHAELAFKALGGNGEADASGKLQKKVFLRSGGYIRVRKMMAERKKEPSTSKTTQGKS